MGRMGRTIGSWPKETVVVVGVQVVDLHHPHQVHRIDSAGNPAVSVIDVVADRLGAGNAILAERRVRLP